MKKIAGLVMTGGGARAAYQVGALRAIYEIIGNKKNLFDVISGNSAGGINAVYLGANCENWDVATNNLSELWKRIKPQDIFDLRKRTISDLGLKWLSGTILGGMTSKGNPLNHLLDTSPLKALAKREINFSDIGKNIEKKNLHGLALSTTNYSSGSNVVFYEGHADIKDWSRSDRFSYRTELRSQHMMASSAIPFFFPPIKIGESFYGDGCIRQTTPLSPSIHLGAEKILAIGTRFAQEKNEVKRQSFAHSLEPTMGQISGVMMNAIFLDSLESDTERLITINELIKQGQHPGHRRIPILMIRPSRDLGQMSGKMRTELPGIFKYLLKGIGVSNHEGLDLLSYLAFDVSYTGPLMELGYEDSFKMKDEILEFFSDPA